MARPLPLGPSRDSSQRTTKLLLGVGGVLVLGLIASAVALQLRKSEPAALATVAAPVASVAPEAIAPARLEPSSLLAKARRQASDWHRDALLVSLLAGPLDQRGVSAEGSVRLSYARPAGQRIAGGSETAAQRLVLRATAGAAELTSSEERAGKGRIAPEPNCLFEDAWTAAQRAGVDASAQPQLRYQWSEKHGRPVWEVLARSGEVMRRLDGVSCSILTR